MSVLAQVVLNSPRPVFHNKTYYEVTCDCGAALTFDVDGDVQCPRCNRTVTCDWHPKV